MAERWSADQSRKILGRIIVEGDLVLQTPAHFGNGEDDDLTDMPLLVDPYDGKSPLLQGTSLAGALRNYLLYCELGDVLVRYNPKNEADRKQIQDLINYGETVKLFGTDKRGEGVQSALIVDDALGQNYATEIRDGVGINPESRTAEEDKLYDTQYWQAGTTFPLRFELILAEDVVRTEDGKGWRPETEDEFNARVKDIKKALATALHGFEIGEITLGMRKHRGFGQVSVSGWRVCTFDMTNAHDIVQWAMNGGKKLSEAVDLQSKTVASASIKSALGVDELLTDNRSRFELKAEFYIPYSMLIRTARTHNPTENAASDMTHLYTYRKGKSEPVPIISGTALAGVLRARARKIAGLFHKDDLIDGLFGDEINDDKAEDNGRQRNGNNGKEKDIRASRLRTFEAEIEDGKTDLVQNRVKIDRFTGGAYPTALFNQKPLFGNGQAKNKQAKVKLQINILSPHDSEIGLLLLLLKDLWTADLAIGGESSVGRGRLTGKNALLRLDRPDSSWEVVIEQAADGRLELSPDAESLEYYVEQFCEGA